MGTSFHVFSCSPLELTIEVDREINLEISTGFQDNVTPHTSVSVTMPLTIEDLDKIIKNLRMVFSELLKSWKCPNCGMINPRSSEYCENCQDAYRIDS